MDDKRGQPAVIAAGRKTAPACLRTHAALLRCGCEVPDDKCLSGEWLNLRQASLLQLVRVPAANDTLQFQKIRRRQRMPKVNKKNPSAAIGLRNGAQYNEFTDTYMFLYGMGDVNAENLRDHSEVAWYNSKTDKKTASEQAVVAKAMLD
eukprot:3927740-Pleurochrysis_carterae.AAC.1